MIMTPQNNVITDFFEVRFLYNQLKNSQFGQITWPVECSELINTEKPINLNVIPSKLIFTFSFISNAVMQTLVMILNKLMQVIRIGV